MHRLMRTGYTSTTRRDCPIRDCYSRSKVRRYSRGVKIAGSFPRHDWPCIRHSMYYWLKDLRIRFDAMPRNPWRRPHA